jgi:hypothetical protein
MTVARMAELAGVSRSSFYRFDPDRVLVDSDLDLRDTIQRLALEFPSYGRPRITAELRRRGWEVNPKRVYRILREDNLLCLRRRKFVVTTASEHGLKVYPNLAKNLVVTDLNQLWVADITYIRPAGRICLPGGDPGCLFAAGDRMGAGPDAGREAHPFRPAHGADTSPRPTGPGAPLRSRRPVCLEGLHEAAARIRHPAQYEPQGQPLGPCGLRIVHENPEVRGSLAERISGSGRRLFADPQVPRTGLQPQTLALRARLPAAGGVRAPPAGGPVRSRYDGAFLMSFLRHGEIYRSDGCLGADLPERPLGPPRPHRLDESPVGYSLAGCSPAEPASASPTGAHFALRAPGCTMPLQRTANSVLTFCLTSGGKCRLRLLLEAEIRLW